MGWDFHNRALIVGINGSGKSELARHFIADVVKPRRVLVDPKGQWRVAGEPMYRLHARDEQSAVAELSLINWQRPIVHVMPKSHNRHQLEALFDRINQTRHPLCVWVDEAYEIATAGQAVPSVTSLLVAGRNRGDGIRHGVVACCQRPVGCDVRFRTEAQHIFCFWPLDLQDVRELLRLTPWISYHEAVALLQGLPRYGFVWFDRIAQTHQVMPPLPDTYRASAAVQAR